MPIFYTDSGSFNILEVTGSTILSGSLIVSGATNFGPSGLTGSLFGSASYADSASYALTASYATNAVSTPAFPFTGSARISGSLLITGSNNSILIDGEENLNYSLTILNGNQDGGNSIKIKTRAEGGGQKIQNSVIEVNTVIPLRMGTYSENIDTPAGHGYLLMSGSSGILPSNHGPFYIGNEYISGSVAIVAGGFSRSNDNAVRIFISSSGNVGIGTRGSTFNRLAINGSVSASSYTSSLNNQVGFLGTSSFAVSSSYATSASYVASASFDGYINFANGLVVTGSITASAVSASFLTSSHVQLNGVSDTTSANKVLVLDTTTNKIFTTASVGGGGSGTGFPFSGSAVITGSLYVTSSVANPITITGSINDFFELEIVNANAGNAASADIVASNDLTTDVGNYIDMGINSSTYAGALVGGPSDGYLYFTSSVGELHVGNASTGATSNVRLFAGGPSSDNTTRVFISSSGNVGINTTTNLRNTLTIQGSVSASSVTGSFTGSFTGALTHFNPVTLKLTVGTTAPSSPAVNDLWVDTN